MKWKRLDMMQRRALLFHEFGHCFLGRDHRNEKFPTGECISLMDGSESGFMCSNNFYSSKWWSYYLDELFDQTVPLPRWYENNMVSDLELTNERIRNDTCLENVSGTQQWCWVAEEVVLRSDVSILIELNYNNSLWTKKQNYFLTINDINFSVDAGRDVCTVFKKSQRLAMLDWHYFRAEDIRDNFPDLTRLRVQIKSGWIYFYLDDKQIHMMELENSKVIQAHSVSSSRIGNFVIYDIKYQVVGMYPFPDLLNLPHL